MTSIKIALTEERKKQIKRICLEQDKTMTQYILECLDNVLPIGKNTLKQELATIEEQLSRYGGKMSCEERTALKNRKNELRKEIAE